MSNLPLPFETRAAGGESVAEARDRDARTFAVDPRFNVALEASAGTGKTRVLVDRYVNLLRAGVDPANILAMTFTRKAAGEMRERILASLQTAAARGEFTPSRLRTLRDRAGDIAISTIDAFCLSLLREFPLEADLEPGFTLVDDAEMPRLVDESLDRTLRICRRLASEDEQVALVFAQLGEWRARRGLASLLARRLVAPALLSRFLARARPGLTVAAAADAARRGLLDLFAAMSTDADDESPESGLRTFAVTGPADTPFMLLLQAVEALAASAAAATPADARRVHAAFVRARGYFLTQKGEPRTRPTRPRALFPSEAHWRRHRDLVAQHAPAIAAGWRAYRHDMHVLVAGGVWRMFRIAEAEYRRTLDARAALDFSDLLVRTLDMLRRMEEFARSRYRLESRYHHVLVDEFQDTSRAQWELVSLLVESWGEGAGLASSGPLPPSIFIVGDRKQSIYGFRDADVSVLGDAVRFLRGLRPGGDVRRSISRSFRSVPALLAFVNDVCADMEKVAGRADAFAYEDDDRFPIEERDGGQAIADEPAVGVVTAGTPEACARTVAAEIVRLIAARTPVRDVTTGLARDVRPGDVAILFRTRESHRAFEDALAAAGLPSYVYKGLGFFEADEIRDVLALLGFLADPASNLRAAALLRSRFARLSDEGLKRLAPNLAHALTADPMPSPAPSLDERDTAVLALARDTVQGLLERVDRLPPAELLDLALRGWAYAREIRGPRGRQAWENLKKIRGLVRRLQNAGYATLDRIAAHLDQMAVGDESNAAIDARDAVNLMTVHAAKGLEFPVVFVVNLGVGTGRRRSPIRVAGAVDGDVSVSIGDFRDAADEDADAQDREETKRLLYVALTRARDRLYLSAVLRDGQVEAGRGSLAEVMPPSLLARLSVPGERSVWQANGGGVHPLRFVSGVELPDAQTGSVDARTLEDAVVDEDCDFAPLPAGAPAALMPAPAHAPAAARETARLFGSLVHRLVHRAGLAPDATSGTGHLESLVLHLVRPEEHGFIDDPQALARSVVQYYEQLRGRQDVRDLLAQGEALHEVPFTMVADGARHRGTIDCVILAPATAAPGPGPGAAPAPAIVLEFKTGRPQPRDREQAEIYRRAAAALFPGADVKAALVYGDALETL